MQIKPILSALRKHRIATLLIVLEVALACAVFSNSILLVSRRIDAIRVQSGVKEELLGTIKVEGYDLAKSTDMNARVLGALRGINGVISATTISSVPFGEGGIVAGVALDQAMQKEAGVVDFYLAGPGAIEALGVRLISGRMLTQEDFTQVNQFVPKDPSVLVTKRLADHLWPGEPPIGKVFWSLGTSFRIIGVIDHLVITNPGSGEEKDSDWSVFVPALPGAGLSGQYLIQANHAQIGQVMRDAKLAVQRAAPDAVIDTEQSRSLSDLRSDYFKNTRFYVSLLVGVVLALLAITAIGIVGLTSFWVAQRQRQIGIRRALGAKKKDILSYFQVENFLIVSLGVIIGTVFAFGLNALLMKWYESPSLPIRYFPITAILFWILGQGTVLVPALRAASISPVSSIRRT